MRSWEDSTPVQIWLVVCLTREREAFELGHGQSSYAPASAFEALEKNPPSPRSSISPTGMSTARDGTYLPKLLRC